MSYMLRIGQRNLAFVFAGTASTQRYEVKMAVDDAVAAGGWAGHYATFLPVIIKLEGEFTLTISR
jgi:hypothetical protein